MDDLIAKVSNVAVEGLIVRHWVFSELDKNGEQLLNLCAQKDCDL